MTTDRVVADEETSETTVHRLEFDVEWPPGHAAAYLIPGEDPILVDAGMPGTETALRKGLAAVGLAPADVAHVVATHPHIDHVGHVDVIEAADDPTVYAPAAYRDALSRSLADVEAGVAETVRRAGVPEDMQEYAVEAAVERTEEIRNLLRPEWVDVWMADGETVEVGSRTFEAVLTPGHQRDHLCLATDLDGPERALFSGDMAIRPFRAAAVHANFDVDQTDGVTAYYRSLDRLESLPVDRVYPGHGPVHDEYGAALRKARDSLDRLCDRTADAIRESGTHAVHVASERAENVADGPWIPEAIAALAHLEHEGRAESHLEDGVRYYTPA